MVRIIIVPPSLFQYLVFPINFDKLLFPKIKCHSMQYVFHILFYLEELKIEYNGFGACINLTENLKIFVTKAHISNDNLKLNIHLFLKRTIIFAAKIKHYYYCLIS